MNLQYLGVQQSELESGAPEKNTVYLLVRNEKTEGQRMKPSCLRKFVLLLELLLLFQSPSLSMVVSLHTVVRNGSNKIPTPDASNDNGCPWVVLVHGLDSCCKTWHSTMDQLESVAPCLAVDQRGSGYSPLGNPDEFSQDALVEDLHHAILQHTTEKVVLLGHSLGGRVVIGYAAKYPKRIAALIIEDMDIAERDPKANGVIQLKPYDGVFNRERSTKQELIEALQEVGYPDSFIEKALATGRIEEKQQENLKSSTAKTSWWTHMNPDFRKLCYPHILSTSQSRTDCQYIANCLKNGTHNFPCHVLVAGPEGTVCIEESIQEMKGIFGDDHLTIHRFPAAGHSIHSTAAEEFHTVITNIITRKQN